MLHVQKPVFETWRRPGGFIKELQAAGSRWEARSRDRLQPVAAFSLGPEK
jgi:hypothetical protein